MIIMKLRIKSDIKASIRRIFYVMIIMKLRIKSGKSCFITPEPLLQTGIS